jgi:hypothetical protein
MNRTTLITKQDIEKAIDGGTFDSEHFISCIWGNVLYQDYAGEALVFHATAYMLKKMEKLTKQQIIN